MMEPGADSFQNLLLLCSSNKFEDAVEFADKNIVNLQHLSTGFLSRYFDLASSILDKDDHKFLFFQKIMYIVTERCKYDDIVFELVDAAADNSNVYVFELTLGSFKILFMRKKNEMYLEWCLSLIRSNVEKICSVMRQVGRCWDTLIAFINDISNTHKPFSENSKHAIISTALYLNRSMYPHIHVMELMRCVATLAPDPFNLIPVIEYCLKDKNDIQNKSVLQYYESVKKRSFATFMYFALTENIVLPQVYSNYYLFEMSLLVANKLLDGKTSEKMKGLTLLSVNSLRCKQTLTNSHLSPAVKSVLEKTKHIMVYGDDTGLRKSAFQEFDALIETFDIKGQYYLFLKMRNVVTHSGTIAHIIDKIKKHVDQARLMQCQYFQGKRLSDLLELYCFIDDTDIVLNAEKHIASLNLFWYLLVLREKNEVHCPGIYPDLLDKYLLPLKELIEITKVECQDQLEKIMANDSKVNQLFPVPDLTQEEKIHGAMVVRNAILVVELNLGRVMQFWDV